MNASQASVTQAAAEATALDPELCYRALASKDARFDGRFFIGVLTTGVYCRPVCPAPTPRRHNVRFYPCAAAAAEAGFRPCLRCRPETSPGTPAWLGTSATVSRALRQIAAGALDAGKVEDLATRLGIGERHLRRLFIEHLGASPVAVAQTRRIHFAKKLIDETQLSMTRIALDAGFSSIRRFNAAIKDAYGRSPSELRRKRGRSSACRDQIVLRLPFRQPFDWPLLRDFLHVRAIPGVETVDAGQYRRTVRIGDRTGVLTVSYPGTGSSLLLRVPATMSRELVRIVARMRCLFDLGADPHEIEAHLCRDARLAERIRLRPGVRVPGAWDGFETAVRAIVGQQVTVRGATTIMGRLAAAYGDRLEGACEPGLTHIFPSAEALAKADLARLGMPGARARAINRLAHEVAEATLTLDAPTGLQSAVARMREIPGIGEWTAQYIAMRALGEPDAFPVGDVGVQRALSTHAQPPTPREVAARSQAWRPWRAYAVMCLWTFDADKYESQENAR